MSGQRRAASIPRGVIHRIGLNVFLKYSECISLSNPPEVRTVIVVAVAVAVVVVVFMMFFFGFAPA